MRDIKVKMLVGPSLEEVNQERYVLTINEDGSCYAVGINCAKEFLKEKNFQVVCWAHCKEIPAEDWRAFEGGEMPLAYLDYCFADKTRKGYTYKATMHDGGGQSNRQLYIGDRWMSNQDLYDEWVVLINDTWQPVGVKI